jgi:hypothetical protein
MILELEFLGVIDRGEASRGVLDLRCGQYFDDCGDRGLSFAGSNSVG